ncbi:MAG: DUF4434 domain-containing protein [Ornithinibacter sp.]
MSDNDPPSGLMIQLSTLGPAITPAMLITWLDDVRSNHNNPSNPGYINGLVLQDIADQNGNLLTAYLDVIAPYLPGGATPAFAKASIGGVEELPWTGPGQRYIEGIEDQAFRDQNVALSVSAAKAFTSRYPLARTGWYISYEANLGAFQDSNVKNAYITYLNQLTTSLSAVKQGAFTWSPSFWTTYAATPEWALQALQTNFTDFFAKVQVPLAMDLQDFVGQSGGATTREDAVAWAKYLQQWAAKMTSVELNAEQFRQNGDGSIVGGDAIEVPARETYYVQQGIPVGPSFEIRFWHKRLYGS